MKDNDSHNETPDLGRSVHLSASAGSGKTRALTERYRALLDRLDELGLGIDQAVAITFTDKAAAEIKSRVMQGLPESLLKKIVRGRQDLRISTIHSFCMNLLKRYPLEAGLPPDFGVLDERDRAQKMQRAVEETLEAMGHNDAIMSPLRALTADELIRAVTYLLSLRTRLKRMEIDAGGPDALLRAIGTGMGGDRDEADLAALLTGDPWRRSLREMGSILRSQGAYYEECRGSEHLALADAGTAAAARPIATALLPVYCRRDGTPYKKAYIAKKYFRGADRRPYEVAFFMVQDLLVRFRDLQKRTDATRESLSLLMLYLRAADAYQDLKLREGLLDFDDLEIYAYRLLRSPGAPDILYWLDRKILHFLVDEFQDTSDIQWAILDRLTEEIFAGQGADKAMPPTLFVVGDQKQSIYRFREANYRLIERVRERIGTLPPELRNISTLDRNYRSVPAVIETVNLVFSGLWADDYQPSDTARAGHSGTVRLLELLPHEESASVPTEADVLAQEIRTLVSRGTIVRERNGPNWAERPAAYGDCAILLQSRTKLKEYEAALLNHGVPFRVVGGIGFYEEDEVQAVMNMLFFLWNRTDRFALASALKSQLFGMTDGDIHELLLNGGDLPAALKERWPAIGSIVSRWMNIAGLVPLADLVQRIILDTGAPIRFGTGNRQAIFNLDKLLDTAREFDRRGYTTLQDFVEWVKRIRASEQREATADMNLPGDRGAVSIMTVHKAKGLEFPVVFLPGMNQQPRSVTTGPLVIIGEGDAAGTGMAMKDGQNPVYRGLWEREQEELRREHQRLLYVAMTRSQDHLVMLGTIEAGDNPYKQHSWLSSLHAAIPAADRTALAEPVVIEQAFPAWKPTTHPGAGIGTRAESPAPPGKQAVIDAKRVRMNIAPIPPTGSWEWKKATDLILAEREWPNAQSGAPGTVSPLTRGSILHRCLENYAVAGTYDLAAVLDSFPGSLSLDRETRDRFAAEIAAVLKDLLGNEELAWILRPQTDAFAELPFLLRRNREIISGVIDRLVIRNGRGYVVDYKSIAVHDDGTLQTWIDHYRPQIGVYCEAAQELFGLDIVEGYLLFLDSGRLARVR